MFEDPYADSMPSPFHFDDSGFLPLSEEETFNGSYSLFFPSNDISSKPSLPQIDTTKRSLVHQNSASSLDSSCAQPQNGPTLSLKLRQHLQSPQTPQHKSRSQIFTQQATPMHKGQDQLEPTFLYQSSHPFHTCTPATSQGQSLLFDPRNRSNNSAFLNDGFVIDAHHDQFPEKMASEFGMDSFSAFPTLQYESNSRSPVSKTKSPTSPMETSSIEGKNSHSELKETSSETEYSSIDADMSESTVSHKKSKGKRKSKPRTSNESPKKPLMPCSIINCPRQGSRLIESLKGALEQDLKSKPSGRVCEAHYRQDLRAHKKNPSGFSTKAESPCDDDTLKRKAPSTPNTRSKRGRFSSD